ncbi:MAG: hypothetical protein GQ470_03770, partial [Gammaproteobacteria bacterium]|nr:hypothetical protein [Gammaproteobacteria bacterium]
QGQPIMSHRSMERQIITTLSKIGRCWFISLFCIVTLLQTGVTAAAENVVLLSIPGNGAHQKFSKAFRTKLAQLNPELDIIELPIDEYEPLPENLVVTLGSRAFKETTRQSGTMFHALISHVLYKEYYPNDKTGKYHMVFNQPLERMLRLHAIVLPQSRDVGVLLGNPFPEIINKLEEQARIFGKRIVIERVEDNFAESLSNLLPKIDSLLLLPDSTVINRSTINSLVLDSYHKRIPLLGYSMSLVKAGAMMALYSTPEQLGEDSAHLVARIISGKRVSIHNSPKQFKVSVNYKLGRVYGITIPSEKELHNKIAAGTRK